MFCGFAFVQFIVSSASSVRKEVKLNCYIRDLKPKGLLPMDYSEHEVADQIDDCSIFIAENEKERYTDIDAAIRRNYIDSNMTQCLINGAKSLNLIDYLRLEAVYENAMPSEGRYEKLREIANKLHSISKKGLEDCTIERDFGEMFDEEINKDESESELSHIEKYCARQLLVSKNVLDSAYHIELNPMNLEVKGADCDFLLRSKIEGISQNIMLLIGGATFQNNKNKVECVSRRFREDVEIAKLLIVFVLSEVNLTDDQKVVERQNFIDFIKKLGAIVDNCDEIFDEN